jgi:hypothetical protein
MLGSESRLASFKFYHVIIMIMMVAIGCLSTNIDKKIHIASFYGDNWLLINDMMVIRTLTRRFDNVGFTRCLSTTDGESLVTSNLEIIDCCWNMYFRLCAGEHPFAPKKW